MIAQPSHCRRHLVLALQRAIIARDDRAARGLDDLIVAGDREPIVELIHPPAPDRRRRSPVAWVSRVARSVVRSVMRVFRTDVPTNELHAQCARHGVRVDSAAGDRAAALALIAASGGECDTSRSDDYVVAFACHWAGYTPVRTDALASAAPAAATSDRCDEPRTDAQRARRRMLRRQDRAWQRPIGVISPTTQAQLEWDRRLEDDDDDR